LFNGDTLATLLYALATGYPDRARNIIYVSDELNDRERGRIRSIIDDPAATPVQQVRGLGDALRELQADRDLSNECYRLAFYLSQDSVALSDNPLFAYFLAHRSGRLMDKWVHYFPVYHRHLAPYRDCGKQVLEIGVYQGGSLDMWARYLGPSTTIVGIDIDESSARLANPARTVVIGDQADPDFLRSVVEQHGPFDVVIDDGGHTMEQQITSVETLFPIMNDDGVYLVEDSHTSYWEEFGGGHGREGTFIEWVKSRLDDLHRYHLAGPVDPIWTAQVDAIHCYDSVVVLDKKVRTPPFSEHVGNSGFIHQHGPVSALVGEMLATRDAAISQSQALGAELRKTEADLTVTRNDLLESWSHIQTMRGTISWRVTAPLREVRRLLRGG
jgi:Methyltransferase domain